jgi:hypothetical protein
MKISHNQLIGIYDNAMPKEWCDDVIKIFEQNIKSSLTRQEREKIIGTQKQDRSLSGFGILPPKYIEHFYKIFKKTLFHYSNQYPTFTEILDHPTISEDFKLQKTLPGEGYHLWHYENINVEKYINRVLVWTVYLNDIKEGGETEFLYQHKRISPKKGTICLFPAYFTHTHRGNPPLSNPKYIATGWHSYKTILPNNMLKNITTNE